MTPEFIIEADDAILQSQIKDRMMEIRYFDRPGLVSDMVEVHLDDRDGMILNPEHGQTLNLYIGYKDKESHHRGQYVIDRTEFKGPPDTMIIYASALNFREAMASEKTRRWDATTPASIVRSIAGEHGYQSIIDTVFETQQIDYLLQQNESDIVFLNALGDRYGALFKAMGQALIFIAQGSNRSQIIKQQLGSTTITKEQISSYKVGREDVSRYTGVKANWNDFKTQTGNTETVLAGNDKKVFTLKETYKSQQEAELAAQGKLDRLIRKQADVQITLPGKPELTCEGELMLEGFRDRVDDTYVITEVNHTLNKAMGFQTTVKAELAG